MSKTHKRRIKATVGARAVRSAEIHLGWSRYRIAEFLRVTTEAIRLWKTGATKSLSQPVSERVRALQGHIERAKARAAR